MVYHQLLFASIPKMVPGMFYIYHNKKSRC